MKKKNIFLMLVVALMLVLTMFTGCNQREVDRVTYNLSKEADNFNIQRRVTIINTRTDKPLLEVIGLLSIQYDRGDIDIIMEVAPGVYKKHFVGLNDWVTYVVEDISGYSVNKYHYEINFLPEMIVPIVVTMSD